MTEITTIVSEDQNLIQTQVYEGGLTVVNTGAGGTAGAVTLTPPIIIGGTNQSDVQSAISTLASFPLVFTQSIASTNWTFNHTLNRVPRLQITDLAGNLLFVDARATSTQILVVSRSPITGIVYAS